MKTSTTSNRRGAAAQLLRAQLPVLAAFCAALPDAVASIDRLGVVILANPAFCALVGVSSTEEIRGRSIGAIAGLGPIWSMIEAALSSTPPDRSHSAALIDRQEVEIASDGHANRPVEVTAHVVVHDGSCCCVVTLRDISKRKSFEIAMNQARIAAEQANSAKTDLVAMVAHEIRTAANGVGGLLRMIEQEPDRVRRFEFLKSAQRCSGSLLAIVGDILDLSKLEAGKFTIEPRTFALADLLSTIDAFWRPQIEEKGLSFVIDRSGSAANLVRGDDLRLCQILHNYVSNALKHTERGDIRLEVTDVEGGQRRLTVSDTGNGIPPEEQKKLFRPFEQCTGSLVTRLKGTGLGLAITRHLAEQMRGSAGVSSHVGQGSAFWVEVMLPDARPWQSTGDHEAPSSVHAHGQFHLLAAEDNAINRLLLSAQMQARGHQVTFVETGRDAIEKVKTERFDGIVLDMVLGDMRGDEVARAIRDGLAGDVPAIIGLTAFNTRDLDKASIESFDLLFEKGGNPEHFNHAIEKAVAQRQTERSLPLDPSCLQNIPVANRSTLLRLLAIQLRATRPMPLEELKQDCLGLASAAANIGAKRVASLAYDLHGQADVTCAANLRRQLDAAIAEVLDEIEGLQSSPASVGASLPIQTSP